ncbi:MAG: zinc-dependent alcohol dehydrogenase family protein [Candidatus Puniceispirillaceae bacterium]
MRAALITEYQQPLEITTVADPALPSDGIIMEVRATGVCRSDWHTWMGHYRDQVSLPLIPGHEMAGDVVEVGPDVTGLRPGDRVTVPFGLACGHCHICLEGNHQSCSDQIQPSTDFHGSFAELIALPRANLNVVRLPDEVGYAEAASLGCRFITAFRGVVEQAAVRPGDWLAVHGCGGVGLSAVMIAAAMGVNVVAVDIDDATLTKASDLGAVATVNAARSQNPSKEIIELTRGGAHASMDALGSTVTCQNSILCLRPLGRHVQVGLMKDRHEHPPIPMGIVVAREIDIRGSRGMSPKNFPSIFNMIRSGVVAPASLIGSELSLEEGAELLTRMDSFPGTGVAVITSF